jgi:hypothetical protein
MVAWMSSWLERGTALMASDAMRELEATRRLLEKHPEPLKLMRGMLTEEFWQRRWRELGDLK